VGKYLVTQEEVAVHLALLVPLEGVVGHLEVADF
jgi:hypothetical protein